MHFHVTLTSRKFSQRQEEMGGLELFWNYDFNFPNNEWHPNSVISDPDDVAMATHTVSITTGPTWRKVFKLLSQNSERETS